MRYRLKTSEVDIVQWHGPGDHPAVQPITEKTPQAYVRYTDLGYPEEQLASHGWLHSKFGVAIVAPGDYLATDQGGQHEVIKPDELNEMYEQINE